MAELHPKQRFRIYIHGNNGFKSSQLLEKLQLSQENSLETIDTIMEFFPFSDLNLFDKYRPTQQPENLNLSEGSKPIIGEGTAILVLISQTEIFSDDMNKLIVNLPYNSCYGLNKTNEMEWWNRVIVVFSFGEYEGSDEKVQQSISGNRGIGDIVGKAGGRYVWITDRITREELTNKMTEQLGKINNYEEMFLAFHEMIRKLKNRTGKKEDFECEFEQTFIVFGSNKSGKTAQENLSLRPYESPPFKLHLIDKRFRLSKTLQCDDKADVNANLVHKEMSNEVFKIQIINMPAFDDPEVSPKVYGEYLARCMTEARKTKRSTTFLILIEMNSNLPRFFERIPGIAKMLSNWILNEDIKSFTTQNENIFFSNAEILFTGADELQWRSNKDFFDQKLQQRLKKDRYSNLKGLVNLVHNQKYVDNITSEPKKWILRNCLKRERPFKTDRIQVNDDPNIDTNAIKENLENYITIFLSQLNVNLQGKPVIVLLIDPECVKYAKFSEFIFQLPNTPDIQDVMDGTANKDPWEYTYIVFKQKMEPHIEDNYVLKELKEKVKTRYIILTENTSDELDQKLNTLLSATLAAGENESQNETISLVVDNQNEEKGGKGGISEDNIRKKPVEIQLCEEKTDSPVKVSTNRFIWEDHPDIPPFVCFTRIQL